MKIYRLNIKSLYSTTMMRFFTVGNQYRTLTLVWAMFGYSKKYFCPERTIYCVSNVLLVVLQLKTKHVLQDVKSYFDAEVRRICFGN